MIIEIIGLAVIANLITHWYTPIQGVKNRLVIFINKESITTILTCPKCFGLYLGLIFSSHTFSGSLFTLPFLYYALTFGAVVSFLSYLFKFIINYIEYYYEN